MFENLNAKLKTIAAVWNVCPRAIGVLDEFGKKQFSRPLKNEEIIELYELYFEMSVAKGYFRRCKMPYDNCRKCPVWQGQSLFDYFREEEFDNFLSSIGIKAET